MTLEADAVPLAVDGVSTSYGKKRVFENISFTVRAGEVFGLVGLNGAGKTTLIRSILGLRSAIGKITLFGQPCQNTEARRNLVYLPEKFQPSPQLFGWEYLSILLAYFGQSVEKDRAREMATALDLDPAAIDRKVKTYSKGMGQKLGLLGSLLVNAALMILDEPMSGLDPRARVLLKDRLVESKRQGRTIFFSSHILADIEEICDRIGIIHAGHLIFLGTPQEFVARRPGLTLERAFLASLKETEQRAAAET